MMRIEYFSFFYTVKMRFQEDMKDDLERVMNDCAYLLINVVWYWIYYISIYNGTHVSITRKKNKFCIMWIWTLPFAFFC